MKKYTAVSLLIIFGFISFNLKAQEQFEGKMNFKINAEGTEQVMDYYTKGDKIRIEMEGEGQESVIMMDGKNMTIVMPAQRMYMQMAMDKMDKGKVKKEVDERIPTDMKRTGETKEINGYECEKWEYDGEEGLTEMWITDDLGKFVLGQNPLMEGDDKPEWQQKLEGEGFFPMLVITKNKGGKETSRFEVTSVEKMSLNNSLFTPPSDFQKMEIPGME